jgi:hypothetical protein
MKKIGLLLFSVFFVAASAFAQDKAKKKTQKGHTDQNKFRQMKDVLATPNDVRTASGAPGHQYTQQKVDYVMDIRLDETNNKIYGDEKITYHNNSKDHLEYLWIQLDQNMRADDSKSPDVTSGGASAFITPSNFKKSYMKEKKGFGFNIETIESNGTKLSHFINKTMMRVNLPKALAPGEKFEFRIKWNYKINHVVTDGGRSGFEDFKDGNKNFIIAQFFPRLCVYNNVEGWQNMQFWGRSEFALEFGDYDVKITVPADHIMEATGELQNEKEVLTRQQRKRFEKARKTFDNPVMIVTQKEAEKNEKGRSTKMKTWHFNAKRVRDFAWASSRKYIWDAMAVNINGKTVMATSLYPKEGNPLWEQHSTRAVANTLIEYSKLTFDYPYSKAVSVNANDSMGMEYPMICFNFGRPKADGTYSDRLKKGMIGVITHEVGHNFFPMIVNSDERQWTWMDEGLNSFVEILAELKYDSKLFAINPAKGITRYMGGDQSNLSPIMSQGDYVKQFGPNAYTKPAAGLYMLRQTIMGPELFDHAFRTYSKRWMFKHPTPADFFRSMEDASGMDLDWFWRGWFYTTDVTDIGIKTVKPLYLTSKPSDRVKKLKEKYKNYFAGLGDLVYITDKKEDANASAMNKHVKNAKDVPAFIYSVEFEKPGGLVMPIIVELTYADGTKEKKTFPAQIWMKNDNTVKKVFSSTQEIKSIKLDPDMETADVDTSNNSWPKKEATKFAKMKNKVKG